MDETQSVGTTGDWNPMTMIDPTTKERKGFDIDIATALAADMGVKVVFAPTTWKTLVNGVVAAKYDMTSSALLSPKRALVAGYSLSYFAVEDVPLMLNKNKGKYNSWEDLNSQNVTVAVTLGTVQEKLAEVLFNKSKIIKVSATARDYQEVLSGRADISMTSNLEAAKLVEQYPQMMVVPVQGGKNPTPPSSVASSNRSSVDQLCKPLDHPENRARFFRPTQSQVAQAVIFSKQFFAKLVCAQTVS